jgi:hypothetical protein
MSTARRAFWRPIARSTQTVLELLGADTTGGHADRGVSAAVDRDEQGDPGDNHRRRRSMKKNPSHEYSLG